MNDEDRLEDRLRCLARATPQTAGPALEGRLRMLFRARLNERARHRRYVRMAAAVAIAASLYLAWMHGERSAASQHEAATIAAARQRSGFIALPYAESEVPLEQPVIVRVQIPVSQLGEIGVPVMSVAGEERVSADLLVGQDGVARAVRLVQ